MPRVTERGAFLWKVPVIRVVTSRGCQKIKVIETLEFNGTFIKKKKTDKKNFFSIEILKLCIYFCAGSSLLHASFVWFE